MSARDFSVMPVLVIDSDVKPLERAVRRRSNSLNVGAICDVEFGATWATMGERQYRVDGQWFACRVVGHEGAIVHVEVLPDVRLSAKTDRRKPS